MVLNKFKLNSCSYFDKIIVLRKEFLPFEILKQNIFDYDLRNFLMGLLKDVFSADVQELTQNSFHKFSKLAQQFYNGLK